MTCYQWTFSQICRSFFLFSFFRSLSVSLFLEQLFNAEESRLISIILYKNHHQFMNGCKEQL